MSVIQMNSVSKKFGNHQVLDNISLSIENGEIFGLLGPSGAGKTTLIKLLIGQLPLTHGEIIVLGKKPNEYDDATLSSFGMVLDSDGLYERLTCFDNLDIYARIYRLPDRKKRILDLMEMVGLSEATHKTVSDLSKGMRQRLTFARAIIHSPRVVFLDEPTSGIDPATSLQIHMMMDDLRSSGTTIFLTTHNMTEAQQMCDRLALLHDGHIIESGTPHDICLKHRKSVHISIELETNEGFSIAMPELLPFLSSVSAEGKTISRIHSNEPNLEDVFIEMTGRKLE